MDKAFSSQNEKNRLPVIANDKFPGPFFLDEKKNCEQCIYRDQDVDAYPCVACHTRH